MKQQRMRVSFILLSIILFLSLSSSLLAQDPFVRIVFSDKAASKGVGWADYDNDGYPDIYVTNGAQGYKQQNFLYHNNGDGTFTRITTGPQSTDQFISGGCSWGDFDNDGDLDLYVATTVDNFNDPNKENFLYVNNGNGTFTKSTSAGAPITDKEYTAAVGWGDYNNDGFVDLFVKNGYVQKQANSLYSNDGDGTFTDITGIPLVNSSNGTFISGFAWGDYNNDGRLDLCVAGGAGPNNAIWRNDGNNTFVKLVDGSGNSILEASDSSGPSWADYDNDGDLDMFMTNFGDAGPEKNFLYRNDGSGIFTKILDGAVVNDTAYSYGSAWGDIDNDGDLDLFVGNDDDGSHSYRNFLYLNNGNGTFTKNTTSVVLDSTFTYGTAFADYNKDGFLDLYTCREGKSILFRNNGPANGNTNHWINIKCVGTTSNRAGIGAKVRVRATLNSTEIWQMREICAQNGYGGHDDLRAHFGLANATNIDELRVEWPSGNVQTLTNVAVNQFLTITESGAAESIRLTAPNGGETWQVGSVHNITWTSSNTSGQVNLEYSTNGGSNWSSIANNEADDGSYSWTVPDAPSTNCLVRITDVDGNPSDVSDNVFTIAAVTYTLTMAVDPSGSGTTQPSVGDHNYSAGTVVNIIATPITGYEFVNWTGDVANPNNDTTTVTMNGNKVVTANFVQRTCVLTMAANPSAGGTTNPSLGNHIYPKGQIVTVIALPATGYQFANWTGEVADANNDTTTVTMNTDKTVTANFSLIPISDSHASIVGENILLEWSPSAVATSYNVYRDTLYNFVPDTLHGTNRIGFHITDENPGQAGIQWTDTGNGADIVGDVTKNYFYQMTAVAAVESAPSNVAGEFDYNLTTTSGTDINEIVVIMDTRNTSVPITNAEELAQAIPNCSDVYYWDAAGQGSVGHVKGLPFSNFAIYPGYPYMVNVTANTVWSLAGAYGDTSFNLITTSGTDINHLAVPLSKASLTTAELLGQDIPGCTDVYYWNASGQGTVGHVVGLPFENFAVRAGYPYYVNVTAATVWPAGGSLLKTDGATPDKNLSRSSGAPHNVYGQLRFADGSTLQADQIQISAWIAGRPEDVLSKDHIGVGCDENYWWVGVSNFATDWAVGDSLCVEVTIADQGLRGKTVVVLSDAGSDNGGAIQISKTENDPTRQLKEVPQEFVLQPNYPNPFNSETMINYGLPIAGNVKIEIFDLSGRFIRTLLDGNMGPGYHQTTWNGRDGQSQPVSSGVYLCRMDVAQYHATMKLVLIK